MRGLSALGFHLIGKAVFWLKSLHRLAFVCFFLVFIFGLEYGVNKGVSSINCN
ncbi:hypothetical protein BAZOLSSOX_2189 [uncultured Gammaproteobacteria bacterium]|nr:hypothetical protein BAZOLSSOX_2189 [uncultured Gammaproteobacteria bacterium]